MTDDSSSHTETPSSYESTEPSPGPPEYTQADHEQEMHTPHCEPGPEEIVIGVMGATGSGKSSFINLVSGSDLPVGVGLMSCTSKVEVPDTFPLFGKMVTLVDTPGFDDSTVSDTDILKRISVYLTSTYESGRKLNGLIYMHRISDFRMTGISRRNFNMFRKLCGDDTLKNVAIVTNMWGEVTPERGAARENELRTNPMLFKPVLDMGAQMLRHDNTFASAAAILQHFFDHDPAALEIQKELVDEGKDISETAAGVELNRELLKLKQQYEEQLAELRVEMDEALAAKDRETKEELDQVRQELLRSIEQNERDRERLSREFAEERAKADAHLQRIQAALDSEGKASAERQKEITQLKFDVEKNRLESEIFKRDAELERQRARSRPKRGFWQQIGDAFASLVG